MWNVLQSSGGRIKRWDAKMELACGIIVLLIAYGLAFGSDPYDDY